MKSSRLIIGILLSLLILFVTISCKEEVPSKLDEIESYIQESPDSAYAQLKSFDRTTLVSAKERAHFALLYSIALDKMYIDLTEDTLINIAVDYYGRERSRNAFLSFFYQGRVYENAHRYEDALQSFIHAESIPENLVGPLYLAKLHFGKGRVYNYSFQSAEVLKEAEIAARYSLEAGHVNNYARAVLDQVELYCGIGALGHSDFDKADSCLNIVKSLWPQLSYLRQYNWYDTKIVYLVRRKEKAQLREFIREYLDFMASDPENVEWMTLSTAYQVLEEANLMKEALEKGISYGQNTGREEITYQLLLSEANAMLGQFEAAYRHSDNYSRMLDERAYDIFRHDTKFLEERYSNQLSQVKASNRLIVLTLIILLLMCAVAFLLYCFFKRRREAREARTKLKELQEEYDMIDSLLGSKNNDIGGKTISVLDKRMRTLKSFLDKEEKAAIELDRLLGDRTSVLESIGMIYAIYAPKFTEVLVTKGLRPSEIGYCCLHLMGYSTKEAGQFICYSGYYNVSSKIRSKLQIDANASTLSKWLKQLYTETQGPDFAR